METTTQKETAILSPTFITPDALLEHWQGHRRITRRMILAFPEDKLFTYSIGGMRPFSELVLEFIGMAVPGINGVITGEWITPENLSHHTKSVNPKTREDLLALWDEVTEFIDASWSKIPEGRFLEIDKAFGQWEGPVHSTVLYFIDNEIHHRGQGYVYLRSLGIEPPYFYDRS